MTRLAALSLAVCAGGVVRSVVRVGVCVVICVGVSVIPAGCTVGPDYRPPAIATGAAPAPTLIESAAPNFLSSPLPDGWWQLYREPKLDALVEKALVHNTDLRVALATLQQAQARLIEAERLRTPQTTLSAGVSVGELPGVPIVSPLFDLGEAVSYDFDLFGRLRRGIEVGRADLGSAEAALDLARVNVAAQTTGAYVSVCAAGLRIEVANRSIGIANASLHLSERRFEAGVAGSNDVVQTRTLLRQTVAVMPALLAQRRAALYLLATLTGDLPEAVPDQVTGCTAPPTLQVPIPVGNGEALLARRPDVRAAERNLAGAVASIGVVTAALYPSVTLGASLGSTAGTIGGLSTRDAFQFSIGPMLSWTFPNQSIVRARIAQADAAARGALAQFDGYVLTALRETETAMVTLARAVDTRRDLSDARDDAALGARNVQRLYAGGLGDFLSTLDAERTLIQAESSLADATIQVSQNQVTLFMALGGGWQDAPRVADVPLDAVVRPTKH